MPGSGPTSRRRPGVPSGENGTVIPIVTPEEMGEIDRAAPEPVEVLIARAAAAVAREAVDLMGGTYGRRVVVVAGKGNNGNDGRVRRSGPATAGSRGRRVRCRLGARGPPPVRPGHRRGVRDRIPRGLRRTRSRWRTGPRGRHPIRSRWTHRCRVRSGAAGGQDGHVRRTQARTPARRRARPLRRGGGGRHRPRRLDRPDAPGRGCRRRGLDTPAVGSTTTSGTTPCG